MSNPMNPETIIAESLCGHIPACKLHKEQARAARMALDDRGLDVTPRNLAAPAPTAPSVADDADALFAGPARVDSAGPIYDQFADELDRKDAGATAPVDRIDTLQQ